MKKFMETVKQFKRMKSLSDQYRLCWFPIAGYYSIIEFFDDELHNLDPKKVEILIP